MLEPDPKDYVWNFPVYIAVGNYSLNAAGEPHFHDGTYYATRKVNGESYFPIFTDADLAQTYIEQSNPAFELKALECSPGDMWRLLKLAPSRWAGIAIDPARGSSTVRTAPFSTL